MTDVWKNIVLGCGLNSENAYYRLIDLLRFVDRPMLFISVCVHMCVKLNNDAFKKLIHANWV